MYIYANHTIYGKYMPYIYHIWYNCTAVHSQKLPIIYERGLVLPTDRAIWQNIHVIIGRLPIVSLRHCATDP